MADSYDVVVIGAGPAGENAAGRCAKAGLKTLIVERELAGGECSYWACMPSKTLLRPGEALAAARRVPGAREAITGEIDATAALARRDWVVAGYDDKSQVQWITDSGIDFVRGHARFTAPKRIAIDTDEGTREIEVERAVVVATGSEAAIPPIEGLADIRIWDSRGATEAKDVPRRLLVIGGGVVAVEMAQAWRRLGAEEVTIVERGQRLLSREEPFAGEEIRKAFEDEGINVLTETTVERVSREADDAPVIASFAGRDDVVAEEVLVAIGRKPRTSDLGVEHLGLEPGKAIEVDDHLRSTRVDGGWLYAIGDANRRALLTHMGKYQAKIAADNITGGEVKAEADNRAVTRIVFTDPQVAAVGPTEQQARAAGIDTKTYSTSNDAVAGATVSGEDVRGTCQLVVDASRNVIVGATFVGPSIADLLHSATIAIVGEVPLERLRHAVPAYPSLSEVWLNMIDEALGTGT